MLLSIFRFFIFLVIGFNLFLSCSFISWQLNKAADYFYAPVYQPLNVSAHIKKYARFNPDKSDYADVGAKEHKRVFSEIVGAIHHHGIGLSDIKYYALDGSKGSPVLTDVEVAHLQEVAEVMTKVLLLGILSCLLSVLIIFLNYKKLITWPTRKFLFGSLVLLCVVFTVYFFAVGFDALFTEMHKQLFSDAPWIFSYSESLLVVLTKSPDYFAFLGASIFLPACLLLFIVLFILSKPKKMSLVNV